MSNASATRSASGRPLFLRVLAVVVVIAIAISGWLAFTGAKAVPAATFTLLSGEKVSTADLKGKVYLINFWATDCETCMQEMPQMISTYNQFKPEGLEFVAVAMHYDKRQYVENYAKSRDLPFKVAFDDGNAAREFGNIQLTPTTFLVGRDGKILKQYVGEPSFDDLHRLIQGALSKQA